MARNPGAGLAPARPALEGAGGLDGQAVLPPELRQDLTAVTIPWTPADLHREAELEAMAPPGPAQVDASWCRVTVSWKDIPNPSPTDWVGLFRYGARWEALCWGYTNGKASGDGTMVIPAGTVPGRYELRLFSDGSYTCLGVGHILQVVTATSVGAGLIPHAPGANLRPVWQGIPSPSFGDWIGLYRLGAPDGDYLAYNYTNGNDSGIADLAVPSTATPGRYQLRLFANDTYTRLATWDLIVTGTGTVYFSEQGSETVPLRPGERITVTWSGLSDPTPADWYGMFRLAASDKAFSGWSYTNGAAAGSEPFTIPATVTPGRYEIRLLRDNGYAPETTSFLDLKVAPDRLGNFPGGWGPTVTSPRGVVVVSWKDITEPKASDWFGLYTPGAAHDAYLAWGYTDGSSTGRRALTVPDGLAPGEYHVRLFRDDTPTLLDATYVHL